MPAVSLRELHRQRQMMQRHRHRAHRHPRRAQRPHVAARRRAEPERVAEVSRQAHRKSVPRRRGPKRRRRGRRGRRRLLPRQNGNVGGHRWIDGGGRLDGSRRLDGSGWLRHGGRLGSAGGVRRTRRAAAPRLCRHEAVGDAKLVTPERPAPGDVFRPVLAVQIGIAAQHVRALARHAVEDVAVDAAGAPARGGSFQPGEERPRPLGAEQILKALAERERTRIDGAQGVVVHELVGQAPAHLPAMIEVAPAGLAQLVGITLAQLTKDRRAAHARATGASRQAIRAVGIEACEVEPA